MMASHSTGECSGHCPTHDVPCEAWAAIGGCRNFGRCVTPQVTTEGRSRMSEQDQQAQAKDCIDYIYNISNVYSRFGGAAAAQVAPNPQPEKPFGLSDMRRLANAEGLGAFKGLYPKDAANLLNEIQRNVDGIDESWSKNVKQLRAQLEQERQLRYGAPSCAALSKELNEAKQSLESMKRSRDIVATERDVLKSERDQAYGRLQSLRDTLNKALEFTKGDLGPMLVRLINGELTSILNKARGV